MRGHVWEASEDMPTPKRPAWAWHPNPLILQCDLNGQARKQTSRLPGGRRLGVWSSISNRASCRLRLQLFRDQDLRANQHQQRSFALDVASVGERPLEYWNLAQHGNALLDFQLVSQPLRSEERRVGK